MTLYGMLNRLRLVFDPALESTLYSEPDLCTRSNAIDQTLLQIFLNYCIKYLFLSVF